jgi:hypothetical protein
MGSPFPTSSPGTPVYPITKRHAHYSRAIATACRRRPPRRTSHPTANVSRSTPPRSSRAPLPIVSASQKCRVSTGPWVWTARPWQTMRRSSSPSSPLGTRGSAPTAIPLCSRTSPRIPFALSASVSTPPRPQLPQRTRLRRPKAPPRWVRPLLECSHFTRELDELTRSLRSYPNGHHPQLSAVLYSAIRR